MANQFKNYRCRHCGHEVLAANPPEPIRWTDGHVCSFVEKIEQPPKLSEEDEAILDDVWDHLADDEPESL